jgi:hypothetical protein
MLIPTADSSQKQKNRNKRNNPKRGVAPIDLKRI